jgi:hypothetical protein
MNDGLLSQIKKILGLKVDVSEWANTYESVVV